MNSKEKGTIKLTVIIPNYNKAEYISQCVESVENQTYREFEIIIVDDKSIDDSRRVIAKLSSKYSNINCVLLNENGGVSNARNIGLEKARTEYVTFLDSDDYYYSDTKLEREMALLLSNNRADAALAYSMVKYVDINGKNLMGDKSINRIYRYKKHPISDLLSFRKLIIGPRDYCISRKLLLEVGAYSYDKNFYEDLDLLIRLALNKTVFLYSDGWGTAYRQNTGGLSSKDKNEHDLTKQCMKKQYWAYLSNVEKLDVYLTKLMIGLYEALRNIYKGVTRK